ncbi:MAG: hypothetical protein AB7F86_06460 [Bdellovibrionales bacterium]
MKNIAASVLLLFGFTINAEPLEFSTYQCNFFRVEGEEWTPFRHTAATYNSKLGWNQIQEISRILTTDQSGDIGYGRCGYVKSSTPDNLTLNIVVAEGNKLKMEYDGCIFSGNPVIYSSVQVPLSSNDQYLHVMRRLSWGGNEFDDLHIVGVRQNSNQDAGELCSKAFKGITGEEIKAKSPRPPEREPEFIFYSGTKFTQRY